MQTHTAPSAQTAKALFAQPQFEFHTSQWFVGDDPINAKVDVRRITPQVVAAHFRFAEPLDPQKGFNPSLFNYFLFCFASSHATHKGYSHWLLGGIPEQMPELFKDTTEVTYYIGALNENDSSAYFGDVNSQIKNIKWLEKSDPVFVGSDNICTKMIRPEYR